MQPLEHVTNMYKQTKLYSYTRRIYIRFSVLRVARSSNGTPITLLIKKKRNPNLNILKTYISLPPNKQLKIRRQLKSFQPYPLKPNRYLYHRYRTFPPYSQHL